MRICFTMKIMTQVTLSYEFHVSLVRSLSLCVPFQTLKSGSRQESTSYLKHKLADHKPEGKAGSIHDVMFKGTLTVLRKSGNNEQEKQVM